MEPNRALLFAGGRGPDPARVDDILRGASASYVIAADSGYLLARECGIIPDLVIGDMDSLRENGYSPDDLGSPCEIHPADKDLTDTELALERLAELGYSEVWQFGGGGGRFDHFLAQYRRLLNHDNPVRWFTECEEIALVRERWSLCGGEERILSVFPLSNRCVMRSIGLKWPLDGLFFSHSDGSCSVSNRISGKRAEIEMVEGRAAVILPCRN